MGLTRVQSDSDSDQSDEEVSQDILERLNAYGNSLLDNDKNKAKGKKSKKQKSTVAKSAPTQSINDTTATKKRKKKKKNNTVSFEDDDLDSDSEKDIPVKMTQVDKLKSLLSLTEEEITKLREKKVDEQNALKRDKTLDPVLTDVNRLKRKKRPPPEVIVFEDPARRAKKKKPEKGRLEEDVGDEEEEGVDFDLKRARWEVRKVGITALDSLEKEEAQVALAVKLGAKPPKKPCLNYKKLIEERKKAKKDEEERNEMMKKLGHRVAKTVETKRRKRDINDVGRLDGQVGKFKFGVQKVSTREIDKMSKSGKKFGKR